MSELETITFSQGNDILATFLITDPNNDNQPLNLTGMTVTFWRKKSRFVPDTDPSATSYSAVVAAPLTGIAKVTVPAADNSVPGVTWSRVDVISGSITRTANVWLLIVSAV